MLRIHQGVADLSIRSLRVATGGCVFLCTLQ